MDVKTIAVIGAGTMGRGIAYASAFGGYKTVLEDVSPRMLEQATAWIRQSFDEGVSRGKVETGVREKALSLISTATDWSAHRTLPTKPLPPAVRRRGIWVKRSCSSTKLPALSPRASTR